MHYNVLGRNFFHSVSLFLGEKYKLIVAKPLENALFSQLFLKKLVLVTLQKVFGGKEAFFVCDQKLIFTPNFNWLG